VVVLFFDESINCQSLQFCEERSDMCSLWLVKDHSSCRILDKLQRFDTASRKTSQENITKVQSR